MKWATAHPEGPPNPQAPPSALDWIVCWVPHLSTHLFCLLCKLLLDHKQHYSPGLWRAAACVTHWFKTFMITLVFVVLQWVVFMRSGGLGVSPAITCFFWDTSRFRPVQVSNENMSNTPAGSPSSGGGVTEQRWHHVYPPHFISVCVGFQLRFFLFRTSECGNVPWITSSWPLRSTLRAAARTLLTLWVINCNWYLYDDRQRQITCTNSHHPAEGESTENLWNSLVCCTCLSVLVACWTWPSAKAQYINDFSPSLWD